MKHLRKFIVCFVLIITAFFHNNLQALAESTENLIVPQEIISILRDNRNLIRTMHNHLQGGVETLDAQINLYNKYDCDELMTDKCSAIRNKIINHFYKIQAKTSTYIHKVENNIIIVKEKLHNTLKKYFEDDITNEEMYAKLRIKHDKWVEENNKWVEEKIKNSFNPEKTSLPDGLEEYIRIIHAPRDMNLTIDNVWIFFSDIENMEHEISLIKKLVSTCTDTH